MLKTVKNCKNNFCEEMGIVLVMIVAFSGIYIVSTDSLK